MNDARRRFYGKYRGTVLNNIDPEQRGRIVAEVPDVSGVAPGGWAEACVPIAGPQCGIYVLPQIGAGVWIEFERGDPAFPIWSGCWWPAAADVPALAAGLTVDPPIVLQTPGQAVMLLSDAPGPTGGILLRTANGAMISIGEAGIVIDNGKGASITLCGPAVDINLGGLTVT